MQSTSNASLTLRVKLPSRAGTLGEVATAIGQAGGDIGAIDIVSEIKVVVSGVGAAGVACTKIIMAAGVRNVIGCDQFGALYAGRSEHMNWVKDWYARNTNPSEEKGMVHDVIRGADVFMGLSVPGILDENDLKRMAGKANCIRDGQPDS